METKFVLNKLIAAIGKLSDEDLRQLGTFFKEPAVNDAIVKVIEGTLALRLAERKRKSKFKKESISGAVSAEDNFETRFEAEPTKWKQKSQQSDQIKQRLAKLLQDRDLFPSTRDVISAVNTSFGFQIEYDLFYRRGRRDLIQKCLKELSYLPEEEQHKKMKDFVNWVKEQPGKKDEHYKQLFRILVGDE